jgi:hypothetical protein
MGKFKQLLNDVLANSSKYSFSEKQGMTSSFLRGDPLFFRYSLPPRMGAGIKGWGLMLRLQIESTIFCDSKKIEHRSVRV